MYLGFKNQPFTFSPPSPWLTCGESRASKYKKKNCYTFFFLDLAGKI